MLTDLHIRNIAIIDQLQLSFKPGLTMLTGETGAGKSIIIDAVGLIMGGRASSDLIRSGEEEAVVEALFDIADRPELKEFLSESGFECDGELLVKRAISRSGKNRIFINGAMATLALLTDLSRQLINIYGQHESQTLLRPENQLLLLDAFAGCQTLRSEFSVLHGQLQAVRQRLEHLDEQEREAERRLDLLSFQSAEIAEARLQPGEDAELEEQRRVLAHAEKLGNTSAEAFERLYDGDGAILGQLRRISASVAEIASIDHGLSELAAGLEGTYLQLEDAAISLRDYASRIETDPAALRSVDDRLDQVGRLKKKYGVTIEEILAFKQQIDQELEGLRGREQDRLHLEQESERLTTELGSLGSNLTKRRAEAAAALKTALEAEAHQLAMKNAVIEAALLPLPEPRATGCERVEFLFSPNPGETPRPLAKIASGGELSRLMLAIKQVLPEGDVPSLVFDEVDTGIGGAVSELVGAKLKNVAARQQVLCITHLPQVAAFADQHLRVEKRIENGRTSTSVTMLDTVARTEEIARMLGGTTITDTTRRHADEMLAAAAART
ncbi:DNA repair protein RecN [Geobacter sp. SVR]|uniref:DNA repair protein RecN n=1 Tax=Geobacter sp. SVR TaxID=2495594 RepID=UPI00143EFC2D|nr:DNA repair protein RecN [Geobacter sp. SVR]BCS54634.1 DNA repair protein RecN [Geobacter sp. SVR]GCF86858.1 DNA repair protein RecN [Geobacter sp. SVR]